ncbi:MAG: hypothetical protein J0L84_07395 [Verrucomicrobia bacterium]|nr:hypothetical protein [Verrucomicrobiota bacterium]
MIRNVLSDIGGVGLYGVISICLFVTVFTGALVWTLLQRPSLMASLGHLPLADGERRRNPEGDSHHE